jgi:hypothetical protein
MMVAIFVGTERYSNGHMKSIYRELKKFRDHFQQNITPLIQTCIQKTSWNWPQIAGDMHSMIHFGTTEQEQSGPQVQWPPHAKDHKYEYILVLLHHHRQQDATKGEYRNSSVIFIIL